MATLPPYEYTAYALNATDPAANAAALSALGLQGWLAVTHVPYGNYILMQRAYTTTTTTSTTTTTTAPP